jgi:hypothetical protein
LGDWLTDPAMTAVPRTILPYLAIEGRVTLLAGREKTGKSTLVGNVVAAASRGAPVLGEPIPRPLRILMYTLDEHPADTVRRLAQLGADGRNVFLNAIPRSMGDLRRALDVDLATHGPMGVIVVDTLSRLFAASGVDANDAKAVEPAVAGLADFAHTHNRALVLLYHTGKGGKEYRGSTAIGAVVDEIITLRRRGPLLDEDDFDDDHTDDGRRLLVQNGRTLQGRVHLAYAAGQYSLYEPAAASRDRVLEVLREQGSVTSRSALAKLVGGRKTDTLRTIGELVEATEIVDTGRGLRFPSSGTGGTGSRHREPAGSQVPSGSQSRELQRNRSGNHVPPAVPETGPPTLPFREPVLASPLDGPQVEEVI